VFSDAINAGGRGSAGWQNCTSLSNGTDLYHNATFTNSTIFLRDAILLDGLGGDGVSNPLDVKSLINSTVLVNGTLLGDGPLPTKGASLLNSRIFVSRGGITKNSNSISGASLTNSTLLISGIVTTNRANSSHTCQSDQKRALWMSFGFGLANFVFTWLAWGTIDSKVSDIPLQLRMSVMLSSSKGPSVSP
jgi:hypothetical protein